MDNCPPASLDFIAQAPAQSDSNYLSSANKEHSPTILSPHLTEEVSRCHRNLVDPSFRGVICLKTHRHFLMRLLLPSVSVNVPMTSLVAEVVTVRVAVFPSVVPE